MMPCSDLVNSKLLNYQAFMIKSENLTIIELKNY